MVMVVALQRDPYLLHYRVASNTPMIFHEGTERYQNLPRLSQGLQTPCSCRCPSHLVNNFSCPFWEMPITVRIVFQRNYIIHFMQNHQRLQAPYKVRVMSAPGLNGRVGHIVRR